MSISRINGVYQQCADREDVDSTMMAVLLALAWHENECTKYCYPSDATVARDTHLSRPAVVRARKRLRDAKLLFWIGGGKTQFGKMPNCYRILVSKDKQVSFRKSYEHEMSITPFEEGQTSVTLPSDGNPGIHPCNPDTHPLYQRDTPPVSESYSNKENKKEKNIENNVEAAATPEVCVVRVDKLDQERQDLLQRAMNIAETSDMGVRDEYCKLIIRAMSVEAIVKALDGAKKRIDNGTNENKNKVDFVRTWLKSTNAYANNML